MIINNKLKKVIIVLVVTTIIVLTGIYMVSGMMYPKWLLDKYASRIEAVGKKYPEDVEIQEGLFFLYGPHQLGDIKYSREKQCEKILALDPNNRVVWAKKAMDAYYSYRSGLKGNIGHLKWVLSNAEKQNADGIKIDDLQPDLRDLCEELGIEYVAKEDYTVFTERIRKELTNKISVPFEIVDKAELNDPENALYNYLKAHIYLIVGENESCIREIERGTAKKDLTIYQNETRRAASKVLKKVHFPQPHRYYITKGGIFFQEFIYDMWKPYPVERYYYKNRIGLTYLCRGYEANKEYEEAEKIYELLQKVALQPRQGESMMWQLYREVRERLKQLHDKMPMEPE